MNKPIKVLFEDDACMVFDKPSGLLVIPTPKNEQNTLVNIVNKQYAVEEKKGRLHPCHRLDRDTSGVILFARGKHNQQTLMKLFHEHKIKKFYVALVQGRLKRPTGEIKSYICDAHERQFHSRSKGKFALTHYKVLKEYKNFSVVEVQPVTGRTNQIRIHLAEIGHPLLGERQYAFGRDYALKFRRVALHAFSLEWVSPFNQSKIRVEAELPKDMREFLEK